MKKHLGAVVFLCLAVGPRALDEPHDLVAPQVDGHHAEENHVAHADQLEKPECAEEESLGSGREVEAVEQVLEPHHPMRLHRTHELIGLNKKGKKNKKIY